MQKPRPQRPKTDFVGECSVAMFRVSQRIAAFE
jgi:hypothetical protein